MKKTLLFLLAAFLFAAVFTGCPHETTPTEEEAPGKYPRNIIFDKKTFDAKQKAWNNSGIKNYQFSQIYWQSPCLVCRTTVKNGTVTAREFFLWKDGENTYDNTEYFDDSVTHDDDPLYDVFLKAKDKVFYSTIDDVYSSIKRDYTFFAGEDFEANHFAQVYIEVNYMTDYPIPADNGVDIIGELRYDEEIEMYGTVKLHGYPRPNSGWQSDIFDFKVLSE